jgi:hypothetical protein
MILQSVALSQEEPFGSSVRRIAVLPSAEYISDGEKHAMISPLTIPAKIHSSDGVKYCEFDASAWFAKAPSEKILELALSGWAGEGAVADAARNAGATNDAVADVLQYVMYLRHGGLRSGYKCVVDNVAALEWLASHRPEVLAMLRALQDGSIRARSQLRSDLIDKAELRE